MSYLTMVKKGKVILDLYSELDQHQNLIIHLECHPLPVPTIQFGRCVTEFMSYLAHIWTDTQTYSHRVTDTDRSQ